MQTSQGQNLPSSLTGLALVAIAGACVVTGAVSLVDAADGWQYLLTTRAEFWRGPTCQGQFIVPGWGDGAVLILTVIALAFLVSTARAMMRMRRWGQFTAFFALIPLVALWMDTAIVSKASIGDCDGVGLSGGAGAAIDRAGWLFVAAMVLCALSWTWLGARINQASGRLPRA